MRLTAWSALALTLVAACSRRSVVVYCAADREYAEPILQDLGKKIGVEVDPVFDDDESKTVGLARRLLEEKPRPRCDVFWNNEAMHTVRLKNSGVLEPYDSPSAATIPRQLRDPDKYWTGFAARVRVIMINTNLVAAGEGPASVRELVDAKWKGRVGASRPLAGSALTHLSVLFDAFGDAQAEAFIVSMRANDVQFTIGNGATARLVADGALAWGIVDTDDYEVQRRNGKPVAVIYPDQNAAGAVLLPNTLSLVRGGPHPLSARKLIDELLRESVEETLAASPSANIPLRAAVPVPPNVRRLGSFKTLVPNFVTAAQKYDARLEVLKKHFQQ